MSKIQSEQKVDYFILEGGDEGGDEDDQEEIIKENKNNTKEFIL